MLHRIYQVALEACKPLIHRGKCVESPGTIRRARRKIGRVRGQDSVQFVIRSQREEELFDVGFELVTRPSWQIELVMWAVDLDTRLN